jgi:beta-galactosidase
VVKADYAEEEKQTEAAKDAVSRLVCVFPFRIFLFRGRCSGSLCIACAGSWEGTSSRPLNGLVFKFKRVVLAVVRLALCGAYPLLQSACAEPKKSAELTVRVDAKAGAPRLVVNGKPVRGRMFFGGPGAGSVKVGPTGRLVEFEFAAQNDSQEKGTLHFRFGQTPGDVFLDDIRLVDLGSGKDVTPISTFESGPDSFSKAWTSWPAGPANTIGTVNIEAATGANGTAGLHVNLRQPADGKWPDWHVYHLPNIAVTRGNRYRVSFWARAEPARELSVALYRPGNPFVHLGGPPGPFESQIKMAAQVGVDFVTFPLEMPWPAPGEETDWTAVDQACEQVLRANPRALLLPRLGADPPAWWRKAHPDEVMTWEDGSQQSHGVVASPVYRREAAARLAALVEHLEAALGNHMGGYHPCGQNTGEWFYQGTWERLLNGYAPADRVAWCAWLSQRYQTDAALQRAWSDPAATLKDAKVPAAARRRGSPNGILRDPATEKPLIDFAEFQQQAMADLVCELAHAVRQASRGRKLVVFFYGYVFEFGPIRLGPSTCGHYALRRVLDCPDIDVLCSPISYFDRGMGGSAPAMTAAESVALAGKMWLSEDDTRTYLGSGNFPGQFDGATNLAETKTMLLRNVAQEATRNFATWWMDLGMTGWFNDERIWDDMRRLAPVDRVFLDKRIAFRPEIAAVIDEHSMLETSASAWTFTEPGLYQVRRPLGRMGAPYGQYLLDDVLRGRVQARLYVFLNAWQLSAGQRKQLCARIRGAGRVWCHAPGLHEENRTAPDAMRELTGFQLVPVSPAKALAEPTRVGKELGLQSSFGVESAIRPLFAAADATAAETLATYPDGTAAVALRNTVDGWSLFVGAPGLTSDLLRVAARKAGVHLYTETDCNVYANGPIIALHAAQDGPVTLDIPKAVTIRDALTAEAIGKGPRIMLNLKKGETRVLRR